MNNTPESYKSFDPDAHQAQIEQKNRNVWLLACGIIAGVLLIIVLCTTFILGIIGFGLNSIKSSAPYQEALVAIQNDERIIEALGEPIEPGYFVKGSIDTNGESGQARLEIPVSGTNGEGLVLVTAQMENGHWYFIHAFAVVEVVDGKEAINISVRDE